MNKLLLFFISSILLTTLLFSSSDIEEIRAIYYQVSENITEGDYYYITEVNVNKDNMSYPAVGVYNSVITYYWDYLGAEAYPEKIVKIILKINRSAYEEYYEFLLNRDHEVIFCMTSGIPNTSDQRFYFKEGKLIRYIEGDNIFDTFTSEHRSYAKTITEMTDNLSKLFSYTFY